MADKKQRIVTRLDADNSQLNQMLDRTQEELKEVSDFAKRAGLDLKQAATSSAGDWASLGMGIASWGAILGKVGGAVTGLMGRFSEMAKEAQSLHTTAEGLQRLDNASRQTGNSTDILRTAYSNFHSTLVSAERGSAKAQKQLEALGLTIDDLGTNGEDAFLKAAKALNDMAPGTQKETAQMKLFGDATQRLSDALAQAAANGKNMDGIVPESTVQRMSDLAAAWEGINDSVGNMAAFYLSNPMDGIATVFEAATGADTRRIREESERRLAAQEAELAAQEAAEKAAEERRQKLRQQQERQAAAEALAAHERKLQQDKEAWQAEVRQENAMRNAQAELEKRMRYANMGDEEREWNEWNDRREAELNDVMARTGWNKDTANEYMKQVWDKENQPQIEVVWDYQAQQLRYVRRAAEEAADGVEQVADAQRDVNAAAREYQPPRERNQFLADRASRRFSEAGEARERARSARERADDLNRQARAAAQSGDKGEARRLREEADDYEAQYRRSLKHAKRVRRRAKADEAASYGVAVAGVSGPAMQPPQIDYTPRLDAILSAIQQLRYNTYVVK